MKKTCVFLSLSLITLLVPFLAHGQKNDENMYGQGSMPSVDGAVVFSKTIFTDGVSADEIYSALKIFAIDAFVSSADRSILYDDGTKTIITKGYREYDPIIGSTHRSKIWVTMRIQSREGRFKVDIYDIFIERESDIKGAESIMTKAEALTDEACLNKHGTPKKLHWNGYCRKAVIDTVSALMIRAEKSVAKKQKKETDDDSW